ncbi:MAG: murein hydrolase activator EnvC family protein [Chitinophagaceae bacterium]
MLKTAVTCFFACIFSFTLLAQTSEELRKQQAEIQREINELKKSLESTRKNKKVGLGELAAVQSKIRLREQAINNISSQIDVILGTINQSRNDINKLKKELDTLMVQYEKSVVYAYKNRSNYDFLNFVFSAASFNDAMKRIEYLKTYRNFRQQQAENIRSTQNVLQQKIAALETTKKQKDEVLQKQEKEKMVLVDERKEKDEVVSKLKAREKEINKEITAKAKTDRKLRDGIIASIRRETEKAARIAEANRKKEAAAKPNPTSNTDVTVKTTKPVKPKSPLENTPEGAIVSADFEKNKGRLPWPLEKGNIKIHFGTYSIEGTSLRGSNPGLTIETDQGASVKAVFDGEVITVFDVDGSTAIVIKHGKYFTSYGNLATVNVSKGQKVNAGQLIGRAATNDDGNGEIEFILMIESKNINPEPWIKRK